MLHGGGAKVCCGMLLHGGKQVWYGIVIYITVQCGTVYHDMVWYGEDQYSTVWYGILQVGGAKVP